MISHTQIGADEDLAREVLVMGLSIAPCLSSFADGSEELKNAASILKRVYKDLASRGSMLVKAQRIGPASVDYAAVSSAFDGQPRAALRALCGVASRSAAPRGSFPTDRPISRMWPERH